MESGKKKKEKKRNVASLSQNRDIGKISQINIAEALSTPSISISAHQGMVIPRTASIKGESVCSARELEECEDAQETLSWRTVVLWR